MAPAGPSAAPLPGAELDAGLQFSRAVDAPPAEAAGAALPTTAAEPGTLGVTCATCRARVDTAYYQVDDAPACAGCTAAAEAHAAPVREWRLLGRAGAFGLGAAVAGAVVYALVLAILELEIALVAILIGYMVGYAVRRGTRGRGGRRTQGLALGLTYLSLSLAYLPVAMRSADGSQAGGQAERPDSARVAARNAAAPVTAGTSAPAAPRSRGPAGAQPAAAAADTAAPSAGGAVLALGALFVLSLALPVLVVVGSLPGGLISAIIMGVGLRQAWQMTAAPAVRVRGPYQVGEGPARGGSIPAGPAAAGAGAAGTAPAAAPRRPRFAAWRV